MAGQGPSKPLGHPWEGETQSREGCGLAREGSAPLPGPVFSPPPQVPPSQRCHFGLCGGELTSPVASFLAETVSALYQLPILVARIL